MPPPCLLWHDISIGVKVEQHLPGRRNMSRLVTVLRAFGVHCHGAILAPGLLWHDISIGTDAVHHLLGRVPIGSSIKLVA